MRALGLSLLLLILLGSAEAYARWPLGVGGTATLPGTNFVVNDASEQFVNDAGEPWVTP